MNPLLNAPPRTSDLHGDARVAALAARARQHDAAWLRDRARRGVVQRIMERISG